jgi:hypothetical protein
LTIRDALQDPKRVLKPVKMPPPPRNLRMFKFFSL